MAIAALALALLGLIPLVGLVLGPIAFGLSTLALGRLGTGSGRVVAGLARVFSVVVTVLWLLVLVGYATAVWQLSRTG